MRFHSSGVTDEGFGDKKGYTILPMDTGSSIAKSVFYSAADKKILATALYYRSAAEQVAVVRYNDNGIVDSSFGNNGVAAGGFSENKYGSDISSGVGALQEDGKIIVSGSFGQNDGVTYNVALFRFNDDSDKQPLIVRIKRWLQHRGISWQVVQNGNNIRYYAVQRSQDGITYKEVASVGKKAGINSYEDNAPPAGNSYYRIAAVGWDGSRTYSNIVFMGDLQQARIYPNPVRDNLWVQGLPVNGKTNVSVVDWNGNVRSNATATSSNYTVNTANLSVGSYLLKIQHDDTTTTQAFVKE